MTNATITVSRYDATEEAEIDISVDLEGSFHWQGSYDPNECGVHLDEWDVVSPTDIKLTDDEANAAIEALYDAHKG